MMKKYKKSTILGKGTYSVVYEYIHKQTNESVAVKFFKDECDGIPSDAIREISALKAVKSEFVIPILEMDYKKFRYIILPKYDYTLREFLNEVKIGYKDVKSLFTNICYGIYVLHSNGIIHRDIKPGNIMIYKKDNKYGVSIIDLGLSRYIEHNRIYKKLSRKITSLYYKAPEVIIGYKHYDFKIDVWALGCVFAELLNHTPLFESTNEVETYYKQVKLLGSPTSHIYKKRKFEEDFTPQFYKKFNYLPSNFYDILYNMLKMDPEERWTLTKCLNYLDQTDSHIRSFTTTYDRYTETYLNRDVCLGNYVFLSKYNKNRISESVTFVMREVLVDWLIQTSSYFEFSDVTYFHTIFLLDSYLCNVEIEGEKLQLVGMACLWISIKLLEIYDIDVGELLKSANYAYKINDIENMEIDILKILDFDILFPSPIIYLRKKINKLCLSKFETNKILKIMYESTLHKDWIRESPSSVVKNSTNMVLGGDVDTYFKNIIYSIEYSKGINTKFI